MSKPEVNMTNWELYVYDEKYDLSGTADNHPSLGKDVYVWQTSDMVRYSFEDDVLTFETRNTVYVCPLKFMTKWPYQNVVRNYVEKLTHRDFGSDESTDKIIAATAKLASENRFEKNYEDDEFLNRIKALQEKGQIELKEMEDKINRELIEMACKYQECVYLEVSNVEGGNRLSYNLEGYTGVVKPQVHSGMFQDSVLYMKYATEEDPGSLDFRYFPRGFGNSLETYSWSDNIMQAVIKNDTGDMIYFNNTEILPGETKVFTPEGHTQGLISPDCYNGKSVFF